MDPQFGFHHVQPFSMARPQQHYFGYVDANDGRFFHRPHQYGGYGPMDTIMDTQPGHFARPYEVNSYARYQAPQPYHYAHASPSASPPRQKRKVSYGSIRPSKEHNTATHTMTSAHSVQLTDKQPKDHSHKENKRSKSHTSADVCLSTPHDNEDPPLSPEGVNDSVRFPLNASDQEASEITLILNLKLTSLHQIWMWLMSSPHHHWETTNLTLRYIQDC